MFDARFETVGQKFTVFVLHAMLWGMAILIAAPFFLVMYAPFSPGL